VVLPELFGGVLARNALQDCGWLACKVEHIVVNALFFPPGCSSWKLVRSYTSSSTMMYRSLGVLCAATSATEKRCDMFVMRVRKTEMRLQSTVTSRRQDHKTKGPAGSL
jgi:hypothetical protein